MNLLSVYSDAAFFPRLTKLDFLQEGHRLEWANEAHEAPPVDGSNNAAKVDKDAATSSSAKKLVYKGMIPLCPWHAGTRVCMEEYTAC
jgi:hypothetical protein